MKTLMRDDAASAGPHRRDADPPQHPQPSGAVDRGGVEDLLRHGQEELADQEDAEDAGAPRHDLDPVRVHPVHRRWRARSPG